MYVKISTFFIFASVYTVRQNWLVAGFKMSAYKFLTEQGDEKEWIHSLIILPLSIPKPNHL